jgi:hypothetical protein
MVHVHPLVSQNETFCKLIHFHPQVEEWRMTFCKGAIEIASLHDWTAFVNLSSSIHASRIMFCQWNTVKYVLSPCTVRPDCQCIYREVVELTKFVHWLIIASSVRPNTAGDSLPFHLRMETEPVSVCCILFGIPKDGQSAETEHDTIIRTI